MHCTAEVLKKDTNCREIGRNYISKSSESWQRDSLKVLSSQVMLVSRGSSEGGGGFATKKVKINTRLTAAPAASITYNFRSPLNKWFSPLEMSFRVNTLLIEMTSTERTVLSYFWERKFWINTRLTGIGWRHKAQLSAASTHHLTMHTQPAHTQDF